MNYKQCHVSVLVCLLLLSCMLLLMMLIAFNVIVVLATLVFLFTFASVLTFITYFLQMVVQLCLKLWLVFVVGIVQDGCNFLCWVIIIHKVKCFFNPEHSCKQWSCYIGFQCCKLKVIIPSLCKSCFFLTFY
jgi:hypothetical protein